MPTTHRSHRGCEEENINALGPGGTSTTWGEGGEILKRKMQIPKEGTMASYNKGPEYTRIWAESRFGASVREKRKTQRGPQLRAVVKRKSTTGADG